MPAVVQVHAKSRFWPNIRGLVAMGRGKPLGKPVRVHPTIDAGKEPVHLQIGQCAVVGQRSRELRLAVTKADEATHELDARLAQAVEIDGHALRRSDQLGRRQAPRPFDVLDGIVANVHGADGIHPPQDVPSAVGARHSDVLSDGKHDTATRGLDLPGELNATRRGADDHHAAIRQKTGVPVLQGREARHLAAADRHSAMERRRRCRRRSRSPACGTATVPWLVATS